MGEGTGVRPHGTDRGGLAEALPCTRQAMRTTLNLDDEALASAMKVAAGKTKTDVINEAFWELARRLQEFRGKTPWEGDLDELRTKV